eukprot:m.266620 g.266620  ORF g.266620 m.266620 type:complete len:327 (-) comp68442_c0_seq1:22-1002(-)
MATVPVTRSLMLNSILPTGKVSMIGLMFTAFDRCGASGVGAVALDAIPTQAKLAIREGMDVVLIGGTTDEWPSLAVSERLKIAAAWRKAVPHGTGPKLMLHTGAGSILEAQELAQLAVELKFDAILVSGPTTFKAPNLAVHCKTITAAIQPIVGTAMPAFYYHFPSLYRDDFPLMEMVIALREACPNMVGAKIAGVGDLELISAVSNLDVDGFGVLGTGHMCLTTRPRGWILLPWEMPAALAFVAANATISDANATTLGTMRGELGDARLPSKGVYELTAAKAFMSAWSGLDVGPCRLPLESMDVERIVPLVESFREREFFALAQQ